MYNVENISGGELVCSTATGKTIRLDNHAFCVIQDDEVTNHLHHLETKGLIRLNYVTGTEN